MQGLEYSVDIAFCIDATGSMSSIINLVKEWALGFHDDLNAALKAKDKHVDTLRVRVIEFRDCYVDGDSAFRTSEFFHLPEQSEAFASFVKDINASGGGDPPESGLEALAIAINSDWTATGSKRRHVIVVWSDTSTHPLEMNAGSKPSNYPQDIPETFDQLTDLWDGQMGMSTSAKRLILFTPDAESWTDIQNHWENVVHYPSKAGMGLSDVNKQTILDTIAQSV